MTLSIKTCSKCGEGKPLSAFYPRPDTLDGHTSACKECLKALSRARRQADPEKYRALERTYREHNGQCGAMKRVRERLGV